MSCSELTRRDLLPNSARYILTYLRARHLIDCVESVTFRDLVQGTGLSPRTVRKALAILKSQGLVKVSRDVRHGRRHLYQLNFRKAARPLAEPRHVQPGLYLIDIGIGLKKFLSPRALAVLTACDVVIHTENVPSQVLDLIPEDATVMTIDSLARAKFDPSSQSIAFLYDGLLDCSAVTKIAEQVQRTSNVNVVYIASTSPIEYALHLLELGRRCRVVFRRSPVALEIYVRRRPSTSQHAVLKCYMLRYSCTEAGLSLSLNHVDLGSVTELPEENTAYIVYIRQA